jgi:hypothetical protein
MRLFSFCLIVLTCCSVNEGTVRVTTDPGTRCNIELTSHWYVLWTNYSLEKTNCRKE